MLIINADDYGLSRLASDRILCCHERGSVTSASAMVFMDDSERAADLAGHSGLDVGLHLNFTQRFTRTNLSSRLSDCQERIVRFLSRNKYAFLVYHPGLRNQFQYVVKAQLDEFLRLYGAEPSHFDGHHHMHLCSNVLVDRLIPRGCKVRRSFSFGPGEKGYVNRSYRSMVDHWLTRNYLTTDFLFSLSSCLGSGSLSRVTKLASFSTVELQTHPEHTGEFEWLNSDSSGQVMSEVKIGSYATLQAESFQNLSGPRDQRS
ncbi:MAG: ChbG/HpnK family deacetylase [Verrucomicrobia bacterium]|nr:ChbG/HpnK family deacetylase [Verrucomicrobiota bacterium]